MSLEEVIEELGKYYARALNLGYVHKPFSWALYQVWKIVDAKEKENAIYNKETGEVVVMPKVCGELIRCKDCKYLAENELFGKTFYFCHHESNAPQVSLDDYCSRAERKEK